jgi:hypothetical protein
MKWAYLSFASKKALANGLYLILRAVIYNKKHKIIIFRGTLLSSMFFDENKQQAWPTTTKQTINKCVYPVRKRRIGCINGPTFYAATLAAISSNQVR